MNLLAPEDTLVLSLSKQGHCYQRVLTKKRILCLIQPSLGLLSYISLVASTHVLVPIHTSFKAFKGTELLLNTIVRVKRKANKNLTVAGFLPTLYAKVNSQDSRALKAINEQMALFGSVLPPIPRSTALADAAEERVPLAQYQAKHPAVDEKSIRKELSRDKG
ncbi:MAG: ParA family protein [Oscillatoria sp. PMC 1051.18]|uniref:ParA family protein n=1 Tax=Oscillatoria salina TaxID=331517 RepID=UPI0013B9B1DA|nr:ParA family protein [Oscillatoria salina]MBZ8183071.1 ParA family protein [Oscillatoria salina IIICB1]MEC4894159.1 ParA family protein [Oscillatoria sp. PMC 1050.18]MEC5030911.1 ParA family protein [Oscillatoria sp. PMC 1051.18]NET91273.1 ParA family protein [Kamptonema sp. SIO1D9]